MQRRLPVGAEILGDGVHFRVWAPDHRDVAVVVDGDRQELMTAEKGGYYSALVRGAGDGTRYAFRLGDDTTLYPDPASRHQPEGPHGSSRVVDWRSYMWSDAAWHGITLAEQVLYEMHIGTFTAEGTFEAAREKLPRLVEVGITCVELMPVSDFSGEFGWGYDGVNWFAPSRIYGPPDALRRFVDAAHGLGLGVILDVVFNHLGPVGNYLPRFAAAYLSEAHKTDWGIGMNYDEDGSESVRDYVCACVRHWVEEYHLDGLRFDATQDIHDSSPVHILKELTAEARAAAPKRRLAIVAENEPQRAELVRSFGFDGLWNDDAHHSIRVAATGVREAYYRDYTGSASELLASVKWGFLYQGQYYQWQHKKRGTYALDLPRSAFVTFLQNHDQIANFSRGARLSELTSPGRMRALTALLLLGPGTPMLFQGQEFFASAPFLFFADHEGEVGEGVRKGRAEFVGQFESAATPRVQATLPDPTRRETFLRCVLDWTERESQGPAVALHRDLIALRRARPAVTRLDGAVLAPECFVVRLFAPNGHMGDRLLVVNLGPDLRLTSVSEPLIATEQGLRWQVTWSSEDVRYGGRGIAPVEGSEPGLLFPGQAAVLLAPHPRGPE